MSENLNKLEEYLQIIDKALTVEHTAKWGLMNAQNMVEHLSLTFVLSTGKWGKGMLRQSVLHFKGHYQANPTDKVQHPYFGLLTFEEWSNFHLRHIEHHLMQFGLLPYPLTPEMETNLQVIEAKLQKVYNGLTIDHEAKWGMMNAHNLVEHLSMVFLYATSTN